MNLQIEKQRIKNELDDINDVRLIKAISELLNYAKQSAEERFLKPFTKQQLIKRFKIYQADRTFRHWNLVRNQFFL
jgi:hypothetical protein